MSGQTLWVICPVYHDVPSYLVLRGKIRELLADSATIGTVKFVVVDDSGGLDGEIDQLHDLADVTLVQPPFNMGHQRALVYGLRTVAPEMDDLDLVVTLDSDGEDRPVDIPRLLAPVLASPGNRLTLALAWRTKRHEPAKFLLLYFLYKLLFRVLTGVTIRSGNFAAYRGAFARQVLVHPHFDLCYSATLVSLAIPTIKVPCERGERYAGRSQMTYSRLMMHGFRMLMPFVDRVAVRSLIVFSTLFGLGVISSFAVIGIRVFTTTAIPGWATSTLIGILTLSLLALANFVLLFVVFTQSRGVSLSNIEQLTSEPRIFRS